MRRHSAPQARCVDPRPGPLPGLRDEARRRAGLPAVRAVAYPYREGILEAIGPLSGRNRIVAAFYDGPGWRRFQPWEQGFLMLQGGVRRARMEILRHVLASTPDAPMHVSLEVGIGDGANLPFLPPGWTVHGVDIARTQLEACIRRHPEMAGRLARAEAESLPFDDATFDACWSIGGFNYFRDHEAALREMRRVTRPGGPVVVADEIPGLHRAGPGPSARASRPSTPGGCASWGSTANS